MHFFFSLFFPSPVCLSILPSCCTHGSPLATYLHEWPWLCNATQPLLGQGVGHTAFSFPLIRTRSSVPGVSTQPGQSFICRRKDVLRYAIRMGCSTCLLWQGKLSSSSQSSSWLGESALNSINPLTPPSLC